MYFRFEQRISDRKYPQSIDDAFVQRFLKYTLLPKLSEIPDQVPESFYILTVHGSEAAL